MKIKEVFKFINEEINAIPEVAHSEVVHHTNIEGLAGILMSGVIIPWNYAVNAVNDLRWKSSDNKIREIATLRRSVDKSISSLKKKDEGKYYEKLGNLSESIGGVKIYLFNRAITAKLRGVTKKPISEYGKDNELMIKDSFFNLYRAMKVINTDVDRNKLNTYFKDLRKELEEDFTKKKNKVLWSYLKEKEIYEELLNVFNLKGENNLHYVKNNFDSLIIAMKGAIRDKSSSREGEERIVFKDKNTRGIPVSPEFMKIQIIEDFTIKDFKKMRDLTGLDFSVSKLYRDLIKYKKAFLIDEKYHGLVKATKEFLEEWEY